MALAPCTVPGCPNPTPQGRCRACRAHADKARGTATQRGYTSAGHQAFREAVLARDPICKLCYTTQSTVADHHPKSRRDCIELGIDPNEPSNGRGLCKACHDRETATHQPGGWNAR